MRKADIKLIMFPCYADTFFVRCLRKILIEKGPIKPNYGLISAAKNVLSLTTIGCFRHASDLPKSDNDHNSVCEYIKVYKGLCLCLT